jgi:polygalacturonase
VLLPAGTYRSGTLFMKSGVTLHLAPGSTLLGSTNLADYPATTPAIKSRVNLYCVRSLIYAENLERIAIEGSGTLDGNGAAFYNKNATYLDRPFLLRVINCRNVRVENIRMQNSGCWNQHYLACEGVRVRGIRVWNYVNRNNDGIDIDGCRDFEVSQCEFSSTDDAICLKSTLDRACESVRISDCTASSHANAIKMGTDSTAGFVDVTIINCTVRSPPPDAKRFCGRARGTSALALEIVDGGRMERIAVSNLTIDGPEVPIFVRLGHRGHGWLPPGATPEPAPKVGTIRGIALSNIVATNAGQIGCSITGIPEHRVHRVEDVTLSNITIRADGGGQREWADALIEERAERYPESTMFGTLPAYGFYCRHVKGLRFCNVRLRAAAADLRHAMVFDDAENLTLDAFDAEFWPGARRC